MSLWKDAAHAWETIWKDTSGLYGKLWAKVQSVAKYAGQVAREADWLFHNPVYAGYLALAQIIDTIDGNFAAAQRAVNRLWHGQTVPLANQVRKQAHDWYESNRAYTGRVFHILTAYMQSVNHQIYTVLPSSIIAARVQAVQAALAQARGLAQHYAHNAYNAALSKVDAEARDAYNSRARARLNDVKDAAEAAKWLVKFTSADDPLAALFGTVAGDLADVIKLIEGHTGPRSLESVLAAAFADIERLQAWQAAQLAHEKNGGYGGLTSTAFMLALAVGAAYDPDGVATATADLAGPIGEVLGKVVDGVGEGALDLPAVLASLPAASGHVVGGLAGHVAAGTNSILANLGL